VFHARRLCPGRPSWNPGRQYDLDPVGDLGRLGAPVLSAARQPAHSAQHHHSGFRLL